MIANYVSQCPYVDLCWRNAYSRYLIDVGYKEPPQRLLLFSSGYVTMNMLPNKGLYAEHMPMNQGTLVNLCPAMNGSFTVCPEYCKEQHRRENLEKGRQRRESYRDARPRVSIPQEIRRAIAKRDKYKCIYCGRSQNQNWNGKPIKGMIDHIIPLALGGHESDPNNLAFSCQDCNLAKGALLWERGCRVGFYVER